MVRSWSSGSPRTISPPTAPQPKPSTESCIPVRPNTRISIAVLRLCEPYRDRITGRHADPAYEKATSHYRSRADLAFGAALILPRRSRPNFSMKDEERARAIYGQRDRVSAWARRRGGRRGAQTYELL